MKNLLLVSLCTASLFASDLLDGKSAFDQKDFKTAYSKFLKASQDGMVAKYNMAFMYEMGLGVKKDIAKAIQLYNMSAYDGYAKAQYKMGLAYFNGIGVKQNINRSIEFLKLAQAQGDKEATKALEQIKQILDKQKKEVANYAKLTVRSNVSNDEVIINGKKIGKTPVTVSLKPDEIHKISVSKKGYKTYDFRDIKLKPKQEKTIKAILTR